MSIMELRKYFVNDRHRLTDRQLVKLYKIKSGALAEYTFSMLTTQMNGTFRNQYCFRNYKFDFVTKFSIIEIKNYLYDSTGTADEKIIYTLLKYLDALDTFKSIIIVLAAKMETIFSTKYWPLIIRTGLCSLIENVFIVNMSEIINEFYSPTKEMTFIKWVGGKSALTSIVVDEICKFDLIGTYVEPFVGSGAILFELIKRHPELNYVAGDANGQLINAYKVIQSNVDELTKLLMLFQRKYDESDDAESLFYSWRDGYNQLIKYENDKQFANDLTFEHFDVEDTFERTTVLAAYFIALNKTCFRGIYRVNSKGEFNVPFGHYKSPSIVKAEYYNDLSKLIRNVNFVVGDYAKTIESCDMVNDVVTVYMDPPYLGMFNDYTADVFNHDEFAKNVNKYAQMSANVIVSNSQMFWDTYGRDLSKHFNVRSVDVQDRINSKNPSSMRNEILLTSINSVV